MLPEERAREKIDRQLANAGWDIVSRNEYVPMSASAVKEALMKGNTESDYLLFVDDKAIAVVEAKREENPLGEDVEIQAENYARSPQKWYGLWYDDLIPLVYLANGKKIYFKNLLIDPEGDYVELNAMHSPKEMLSLLHQISEYGALPRLEKRGLHECQYDAEISFEQSLKDGNKKNLAILATGSGKTYLACLASYRLLNYTPAKKNHRGVGDFFSSGVSLNKAMDFTKCHKDTAIARTMAKIPMYVRSIEKEYDVTILDQTRRRQHGGRQRRKPDYMSECA